MLIQEFSLTNTFNLLLFIYKDIYEWFVVSDTEIKILNTIRAHNQQKYYFNQSIKN